MALTFAPLFETSLLGIADLFPEDLSLFPECLLLGPIASFPQLCPAGNVEAIQIPPCSVVYVKPCSVVYVKPEQVRVITSLSFSTFGSVNDLSCNNL